VPARVFKAEALSQCGSGAPPKNRFHQKVNRIAAFSGSLPVAIFERLVWFGKDSFCVFHAAGYSVRDCRGYCTFVIAKDETVFFLHS
jgi:hypothetical protein